MVMMRAVPAAAVQSATQNGVASKRRFTRPSSGRAGRRGKDQVEHVPEWRAPAPIWDRALSDADRSALFRPVVLRFDRDEFMDDLPQFVAKIARGACPGTSLSPRRGGTSVPAGSLRVTPGGERWPLSSFSLRTSATTSSRPTWSAGFRGCRAARLIRQRRRASPLSCADWRRVHPDASIDPLDPASYVEEAWGGPEGGWRPVEQGGSLAEFDDFAEERHPLFGVFFQMNGQKRRILAGLIPVTSRESYEAKGAANPFVVPRDAQGEVDPRIAQYESRVDRPLKDLLGAKASRGEAAEASSFILYDFAQVLHDHLAPVWEIVVREASSSDDGLESPEGPVEILANRLLTERFDKAGTTWAKGLVAVWQGREALLAGEPNAPSFTIDPDEISTVDADSLHSQVTGAVAALGPYEPPPADPSSDANVPSLPMLDEQSGAFYVVRCVYERPHCKDLRPPIGE